LKLAPDMLQYALSGQSGRTILVCRARKRWSNGPVRRF